MPFLGDKPWAQNKLKMSFKNLRIKEKKIREMFSFGIWLPGGEVHDARVPVLSHLVLLNQKVDSTQYVLSIMTNIMKPKDIEGFLSRRNIVY